MGTEPRRHHFIPEFYLAGFTPTGSSDDFLVVKDKETEKAWTARPGNVAVQKDFYTVQDVDEVPPAAIEEAFADFESRAATTIAGLSKEFRYPEPDELDTLIAFGGMLIIRVPSLRKQIEDFKRRVAIDLSKSIVATPERYQATVEAMKRDGLELPGGGQITHAQMKEFIEDQSRYTLEIDQTVLPGHTLELWEPLTKVLRARKWTMFVSEGDEAEFITSDQPLSIVASSAEAPPFLGYGSPHTEVGFPLTRNLALVGSWDKAEELFPTDALGAGVLNSQTYNAAARFVFSANPSFRVTRPR